MHFKGKGNNFNPALWHFILGGCRALVPKSASAVDLATGQAASIVQYIYRPSTCDHGTQSGRKLSQDGTESILRSDILYHLP
jgi:hypothetical protein